MKQLLICMLFVVTAGMCFGADTVEFPRALRQLPSHTRAFVYVRGYKSWPMLRMFGPMVGLTPDVMKELDDELLIALLEIGKGDNVKFLVGAKTKEMPGSWNRVLKVWPFQKQLNVTLPENTSGPVSNKRGGRTLGFLSHGKHWVWFSNSEAIAQGAASGTLRGNGGIKDAPHFLQRYNQINNQAPLIAWADLETILRTIMSMHIASPRKGFINRLMDSLNLEVFTSAAASLDSQGIRAAVGTKNINRGLPAFLFCKPQTLRLAVRLPADGSVIAKSMNSGKDLIRLYKTIVASIDPEILEEYNTEIREFEAVSDVNLETFLGYFERELILFSTPMNDSALLTGIKNRKALETSLNLLFERWKKQPEKKTIAKASLYIKGKVGFLLTESFFALGSIPLLEKLADGSLLEKAAAKPINGELRQPLSFYTSTSILHLIQVSGESPELPVPLKIFSGILSQNIQVTAVREESQILLRVRTNLAQILGAGKEK